MSREHLWPEWFSRIEPKTRVNHQHTRINLEFLDGTALIKPSQMKRAGDPASLQLKVVCGSCNRNWMSKIEDEAKKILEPMILGVNTTLTIQYQIAIREWIALKTIIGEYDDENSITIDAATRQAFYKQRALAGTWKLWIRKYIGKEWITRRRHETFYAEQRPVPKSLSTNRKNAQCTTMVGGQLFIHSIWTSTSWLDPFGFRGETGNMLMQIHPEQGKALEWPPDLMGDDDAEFVSRALGISAQRSNERHQEGEVD